MIITIGVILIGGHFFLLLGLANSFAGVNPSIGLPIFMVLALLSAVFTLRLQTRIEMFFIRNHLKRHPGSGWNVLAAAQQSGIKTPRGASGARSTRKSFLATAAWFWGAEVTELVPERWQGLRMNLRAAAKGLAGRVGRRSPAKGFTKLRWLHTSRLVR